MVRAILEGRKTVTRRVVRRPREASLYGRTDVPDRHFADQGFGDGIYLHWAYTGGDLSDDVLSTRVHCPYGVPGDRLWVKSKWLITDLMFKPESWNADSGDDLWVFRGKAEPKHREHVRYAAELKHDARFVGAYRSSLLMPRWASRLTLEITGVRVERLHDITEDDAKAEGALLCDEATGRHSLDDTRGSYRLGFWALWDAINGKRCPWSSNPWVWRVEFRKENP